jgi:hypothetical protein
LNPLLGITEALGSAEDSMRGTVGIPPGPVDIERINADAIETAHALEALISLGDDEATRQVDIAQLGFVDMLTDLNQDIQGYLLLTSGVYAYERTWDQRTQDELYSEIQDEQQTLKRSFNDLLQIAANDPDRVSQIGVAYQDAVTAITHWTPQSDWVWYGATPEEAGP